MNSLFNSFYQRILSPETKRRLERAILTIAIISFLTHLGIIFLVDFGILSIGTSSGLLTNPIAAIYTPFSFILVYEVYLLLFYLPNSISTYISKQYEIITLIIIRRLFKDLSNLELSSNWFQIKYDLNFTYDLIASLLLFFLIFQFNKQSKKSQRLSLDNLNVSTGMGRFVKIKKIIAASLVPILFVLAIYSFTSWSWGILNPASQSKVDFENINYVFFEQFFTILIITDVVLLLISFYYTDEFHKVIRNSGFIISTILIRLSFSVTGLLNIALIITAIVFGLLMLIIHNQFEKENSLGKELNS